MSVKKDIDRQFDNLGKSIDRGIDSLLKGGGSSFFQTLWLGLKEFIQKRRWRTKRFLVTIGMFSIMLAVLAVLEMKYIKAMLPENRLWNWIYHEQVKVTYPLTALVALLGILGYFNGIGKEVLKLRFRFQLAFERCGLFSKRRIIKDKQTTPEYPKLLKELTDQDGGVSYIFRNVGLPLEDWIKVKPNLESSLEMQISKIDLSNKNPGYIEVKIGGVDIPKIVEFNEELLKHGGKHRVVVGVSKNEPVTHDFKSIPHILIAGTTGAGKTVAANAVAYQCMTRLHGLLYLIDFKGGADYADFEDLGISIISERVAVAKLLERLLVEHKERTQLFRHNRVKNIVEYNDKFPKKKLRRCFILIDELAELTDRKSCPKDEQEILDVILGQLSSIARLTRSTGINLLLGMQRPDANVIPGQIKNNVPARLCGYFSDDVAYRIVLDFAPYPRLPDPEEQPGRFIYSLGAKNRYIQTPHFQEHHIDKNFRMDYETGVLTLEGVLEEIEAELEEVSPVPSQRRRYVNTEI